MTLIPPDRPKLTLDLHDGQPPLELWFNQRALFRLAKVIGASTRVLDLPALVDGVSLENAHHYLWAGELWRGAQQPKLEIYQQRFLDCVVPTLVLFRAIRDALISGTVGEGTKDPGTVATTSGNGSASSASPSPS